MCFKKNEIRTFSDTVPKKKKKKTQNGRPETIKLEENIGRTLFDVTIIF